MKIWKLFLMCLTVATMGLTACSDDDDNGGGSNGKIVGTWACVTDSSWVITFTSNGTFTESLPVENYYDNGTYTFDGTVIRIKFADGSTEIASYDNEGNGKEWIDYCGETFQRR